MEMASIGFLLGALTAIIFVGIGVCFGRADNDYKRQSADDSDMRVYVPDRDRTGGGDNRRYSPLEMTFVLNNVKRLTHGDERKIMDAIIELVEGSNV